MFHDEIKAATDHSHRQAEESRFIVDLMSGKSSLLGYFRYMQALAPVYKKMESLLEERSSSTLLNYFDHRALDRYEKIEKDLDFLAIGLNLVGDWRDEELLAPTKVYLSHLDSQISDARLLAHHYIRYLGDLSGGRIIGRMMQTHYSIAPQAMNFYDFDGVGDAVFYKRRYRDLLNLVPFTATEKEQFLDEVVRLYQLTTAMFKELEIEFATS
ncbi:MAG: biliverdin-producing heme oxygenase [Actinomycetota bacterium]